VVGSGDRLREERVALGLKQEELAQVGEVNRNTQGSYEKGDRNPDIAYLTAIATTGVDIFYVITGQRNARTAESLSEAETQLLDQYRAIPDADQQAIHPSSAPWPNSRTRRNKST